MTRVGELTELAGKMIEDNQAAARAVGAVYKFVLSGNGGGVFFINLTDAPGVTTDGGAADCTFTIAAHDFVNLFENRVGSRQLFFAGKLGVEGNIGVALKLKQFLDAVRQQRVSA